jgi:hypothetical protein
MNISDKNKTIGKTASQNLSVRTGPRAKIDLNSGQPSAGNFEQPSVFVDTTAHGAKDTSSPVLAPALRPPTVVVPQTSSEDDIYLAMDVEKTTLIAQLVCGGTLHDAAHAAMRIAELHGKPRHADEVCAMADRLIDDKQKREQVKLAAGLVVLGEWKSPAKTMLSGRLSDEDKRAHIFPISQRAAEVLRQIEGGEPLALAIEGSCATGVAPWLHASRDISAMAAPRKWRQDEAHPDGRLSLLEIRTELEKNNARPGRDPEVTTELFARYEALENR